ncbi:MULTISPECIES: thioredoxin family protein [Pseudomonas]|uniref:Thioredoxin family protein n=1 Tax=Pseudomonas luteola TaxID=47886 RepID=A0ABS0MVY0_PSELU|nr:MULTISPECIES: thioredoxin family protein [unclassified Pseudomonas]MBH3440844.1 thioredoxin family protein [Pseudomonas luteola]MDN3237283.1 thioredoxin family protein [Pseudomonas sp. WAC2]
MELSDLDADQALLALSGVTLLIFTSEGCSSCRWARERLPEMSLPCDRIAWVDAERNGGMVQRYEVFHLPALFVVRQGLFYGGLKTRMTESELNQGILACLSRDADDLP